MAAAMLLILLNSCGIVRIEPGSTSQSAGKTAEKKDKYKIYMVDSFIGYFYCNDVFRGAVEAADELGDVEIIRVGPYSINTDKQIEAFNDAIADGADAIFVTALAPDRWIESINKAVESGIPVICYDCDASDSERIAYYGTMNYRAGYMAGLGMTERLGRDGKVAIMLGSKEAQNNIERITGFMDALKNESNLEVVCIEPTNNLLTVAIEKAQKIFDEHPDITGIFASSGSDAQAAVRVMKNSGIDTDSVTIIGFDDDAKTLELIKSGDVFGTIVQNTHDMGYESVMHLYGILKGELPDEKAENGSDVIDTGIAFVTKDNVETYKNEWEYLKE